MGSMDKSYKSILFEYCQKKKIGPPSFNTVAATSGEVNGFQSEVAIAVTNFGFAGVFPKKKQAENDAARMCLVSLGFLNEPKDGNESEEQVQEPTTDEKRHEGEADQKSEMSAPDELLVKEKTQTLPANGTQDTSPSSLPARSPCVATPPAKKPKSILHEYCQKFKLPPPQYDTQESYNGNRQLGFTCVLIVDDQTFSDNSLFPTKREAEHFIAAKALDVLKPDGNTQSPYSTGSPYYTGSPHTPYSASPVFSSPMQSSPGISYKNLLQEHLHQRGLDNPIYDTKLTGYGYKSAVIIEGKMVEAEEEHPNKKLAEQSAAKAGLIEVGIKDPEATALRLLRRRSKGHFPMPGPFPFRTRIPTGNERETWIHTRTETSFDSDTYDEADSGYTDFQQTEATPLKRSLDSTDDEETSNKRSKIGGSPESIRRPSYRSQRKGNDFELADVHLGNLSVGEAWPEKKNVVIIGSGETSIPLYCNGARGRCALRDKKTSTLVDIQPGHRLVGLEGHYVEQAGQIVLRARQCEEVVSPPEPDKVLVSCGVVVMHCIPRKNKTGKSCDVNILLKRYLCSQAFVNVVRGLSQYFRQKVIQRPVTLNKSSIVGHITEWMLEEVMAIASMTEEAVRNVFRHTMKFNKRWATVLNAEELPEELKEIKKSAQEELSRRASAEEDQNEDRYRPWRLPKGNFHHRILSTGVFIESPAECGMRELREETGIRLKLNDIASSPFVDLSQADNLNPHKGDVARYYLCGIITEDEGLTEGTNQEQRAIQEKLGSSEDANIIRSPSVVGALHEECTWHDVETAKDISQVFKEVYSTTEFQRLLDNLKKIVTAM